MKLRITVQKGKVTIDLSLTPAVIVLILTLLV